MRFEIASQLEKVTLENGRLPMQPDRLLHRALKASTAGTSVAYGLAEARAMLSSLKPGVPTEFGGGITVTYWPDDPADETEED